MNSSEPSIPRITDRIASLLFSKWILSSVILFTLAFHAGAAYFTYLIILKGLGTEGNIMALNMFIGLGFPIAEFLEFAGLALFLLIFYIPFNYGRKLNRPKLTLICIIALLALYIVMLGGNLWDMTGDWSFYLSHIGHTQQQEISTGVTSVQTRIYTVKVLRSYSWFFRVSLIARLCW